MCLNNQPPCASISPCAPPLQAEDAAQAEERFLREIKVQASLRHTNIAALHTAMKVDNSILMFMEMVEGIGLNQRLRRGSLQTAEAVDHQR